MIDDFKHMDSDYKEKETEKKDDSSCKPAEGSRKKMLARKSAGEKQSKESTKRQKSKKAAAEYEQEKEELRMWLIVVPDEEETIIRADGNTSYHKSLSSMLRKFDRQDVVGLYRLVMKRFKDIAPKGYNLLLLRYLKLEAEAESTMALELLKFTKSQVEE
ncbi:hypothetical protein Tco_0368572 [Tanacetum coccineum]